MSFFTQHRRQLFHNCTDFRVFSHCQEHYLFQIDSDSQSCHSYSHEEYIRMNYTGVTMTLPLSPQRLDRLPLHFHRWGGPMSIAIQLNEEELDQVAGTLTKIRRANTRFTLYLVKKPRGRDYRCTFISMNRTEIRSDSCFVINVLRNLAIETIRTTHFMIVDGDGVLSSSPILGIRCRDI